MSKIIAPTEDGDYVDWPSYVRGYRAGAAAMREQDAKLAEYHYNPDDGHLIAGYIRASPLPEPAKEPK